MYRCAWLSLLLALPAATSEQEPRQVDIRTVDRVDLKGKYYPGDKNSGAPCVIMLHAIGDSSNNKEWINLAKKLNERGFAVLTFDFRGHGDSTTVHPGAPNPNPKLAVAGFWDEAFNRQYIKGAAKRPTEIKFEQFTPNYYTALINDIAAAKAFLDEQPDCNSHNLVLIGANDGATLGAIWLNSEFHRYRYVPPGPGQIQMIDRQNPEGLEVKAAVWLSMTPNLGSTKGSVNLLQILELAARGFKVPMLFVYGEGDSKGADVAKKIHDKLVPSKLKKEFPFTEAMKITGAEQMSGKNLLLESLGTTDKIMKYLEDVPDSKSASKKRNADEITVWEWIDAAGQRQAVAKKKGAERLDFSPYTNFLR
jgi:hypothetical protein